jgi:hypothetical protein
MKIADHLRLRPFPITAAAVSATLPFVIPSAAEGPAVVSTSSERWVPHSSPVLGLSGRRSTQRSTLPLVRGSELQISYYSALINGHGNVFPPSIFSRSHGSTFAWCR